MNTEEALAAYEVEHNAYHNISAQRRLDSRRVLMEVEASAGVPLLDVSPEHLAAYFSSMIAAGKAPATVRKHRNFVTPFMDWAMRRKLITRDRLWEIREVELPRGASQQPLPRPYSRDEVQQIWADAFARYEMLEDDTYLRRYVSGTSRYQRVREHCHAVQLRAIIAVCLFGGLRLKECYRLSTFDAHYDNAYVVVHGASKNRAAISIPREVPWMAEEMRQFVRDWIDLRAMLAPRHDRMWLSLWSASPTEVYPFTRFELQLTELGIGWEFHRLRHTAATEWVRSGMPLEKVQYILGHSRIQQTMAYVKVVGDDAARSARSSAAALSLALAPA